MKLFRRTRFLILIAVFSFLGFLDATYLTITHYQNTLPPCSITFGCETVLTSKYSTIGTIPVSLPGSIFYLTAMIFSIVALQTKRFLFIKILLGLAVIGVLVSIGFFLIQALIIKSFCQYCLFSEAIALVILILTIFVLRTSKYGKT